MSGTPREVAAPGCVLSEAAGTFEHMSEQQIDTQDSAQDTSLPGNNSADVAGGGVGDPAKDPSDWVTGGEPMTGPQKSYLETLAREAGKTVPDDLDKAGASKMIDQLQNETGRGK